MVRPANLLNIGESQKWPVQRESSNCVDEFPAPSAESMALATHGGKAPTPYNIQQRLQHGMEIHIRKMAVRRDLTDV